MALSLPQALLLFALDDDRGTVHSAAFLAIDHGLRGAVLSELKLRGFVQARATGELRHHPRAPARPTDPVLASALECLADAPSPGPAEAWLDLLAHRRPNLRRSLIDQLGARGILGEVSREGASSLLPGQLAHPMTDGGLEEALRQDVGKALDAGDRIEPRMGILLALTVACHLDRTVFGARARDAAGRADWVADRDTIVRATREAISQAEGY